MEFLMGYRNASGALLPDSNLAGVRYVNGGWVSETLYGSDGPDQFEGGGGRDTLVGGAGDDFYWVRDTKDVVRELAGGGIDTVKIYSGYQLSPNIENLVVFGHGSYAAGNNGANIVQGLDGDQFVYGGQGEDVLLGGNGADTFIVKQGEGNKVIQDFQSWSDKVRLVGGALTSFDAVKAAMTQQGADVSLNDGGTLIVFRNTTVGQFAARDFQLPINRAALGPTTFSEEFNSVPTAGWATNYGYAGDGLNSFTLTNNGEKQLYVAPDFKGTTGAPLGLNPFSASGGILTITAQPVSAETSAKMWGYQYTSGMLSSSYVQTYGYFEIRAELPLGQGLWPAFWMLGPNNNEIDILEQLGSDPLVPYNALHSNMVPAIGLQNFVPTDGGFHTYGALWNRSDVIYYVDGTEVWRTPTPADMDKPMHMIVNLAIGGPWAGAPDATTPWPARMNVDYIRAWNLPDANAPPPTPPPPPPPTPPPSGGGLVLTSPYPGATVTGGAGIDTLNASQGADVLTGGGGGDTFAFKAMPWSAGRITDFAVGADRLDIRALFTNGYSGANPVSDGYLRFESNGAGGTRLIVDVDGPGGPSSIGFHVVTLQGVAPGGLSAAILTGGGGPATPPPAPPPTVGVVLTSPYPGATLAGGSGGDTLNASQGADRLTGGAGGDSFVFGKLPWNAGHVTDFTRGSDLIDLRGLAVGYSGSAAARDVYLTPDGAGGTLVMVDIDGPAGGQWPFRVVHLDGVAPGSLSASDWIVR
jgi:beta-glucanase (GH16 family)